jgi:rRNA-processing protein FCF1
MAATTAFPPRLAVLDTNVLFHLAEQDAEAHNLVRRLVRFGFTPVVVQTVVQELGHAVDFGDTQQKRKSATIALTSMREWGIQPIGLRPVGNGICDVAANVIAN